MSSRRQRNRAQQRPNPQPAEEESKPDEPWWLADTVPEKPRKRKPGQPGPGPEEEKAINDSEEKKAPNKKVRNMKDQKGESPEPANWEQLPTQPQESSQLCEPQDADSQLSDKERLISLQEENERLILQRREIQKQINT